MERLSPNSRSPERQVTRPSTVDGPHVLECAACGTPNLHRTGIRIPDASTITILLQCEYCERISEFKVETDRGQTLLIWDQ